MEERAEKAVALMQQKGYNCAQAVACVFAEEAGADKKTVFRMAEGFGSGMRKMQGVCGALVGAVMLAGLSRSTANLEQPDSKPRTAALARTLMKAFEQEAGVVYCKDLKGVGTGKQYRAAGREALTKGKPDKAAVISCCNLGTVKYQRQKERNRARTVSFINAALNRMLLEEKPCRIVITHPVKVGKGGNLAKTAQRKLARSFRGFIRERLGDSFQGDRAYLFSLRSDGTNNRRQPLQVPALWL